jgi:hypothetical protein
MAQRKHVQGVTEGGKGVDGRWRTCWERAAALRRTLPGAEPAIGFADVA